MDRALLKHVWSRYCEKVRHVTCFVSLLGEPCLLLLPCLLSPGGCWLTAVVCLCQDEVLCQVDLGRGGGLATAEGTPAGDILSLLNKVDIIVVIKSVVR